MNERRLLLIFTRNPELGKVKTRLAASIGDQNALDIYTFLLEHTVSFTQNLKVDKQVHYSVKIRENDIWNEIIYTKKQQHGADLGIRMQHAFEQGFEAGYNQIIIIGSDMYDLNEGDLEDAFSQLSSHDFVIGPAQDGGYYLLGMKQLKKSLFKNKTWGTSTVLADSMKDIEGELVAILEERNDIDVFEDIKDIPTFARFIKV